MKQYEVCKVSHGSKPLLDSTLLTQCLNSDNFIQVAWKLIWISGIMALGSKLWPCNQEVVELSPVLNA